MTNNEKLLIKAVQSKNKNEANTAIKILLNKYHNFIYQTALQMKEKYGFRQNSDLLEDCIELGNCALFATIMKFDLNKNNKLLTYAKTRIENEIKLYIFYSNTNSLSEYFMKQFLEIHKAIVILSEDFSSNEPLIERLLAFFNGKYSKDEICLALNYYQDNISLDRKVDNDSNITYHEIISKKEENDNYEKINFLLNGLSKKEKYIITYSFGINGNDKQTIKEISNKLHCSESNIRKIYHSALLKMRKKSKDPKYQYYC